MTSNRGSPRSQSSSLAISLRLKPPFPPQHRDRHLAEALRIHLDLALRRQPDDPRRIPQPIEDARRMAEQRHLLLEEHADAAEEHLASG